MSVRSTIAVLVCLAGVTDPAAAATRRPLARATIAPRPVPGANLPPAFRDGSFRFPKSTKVLCQDFYGAGGAAIDRARGSGDWAGVVEATMAHGCGADIAYYLLGEAAEQLRLRPAAQTYYEQAFTLSEASFATSQHCTGKMAPGYNDTGPNCHGIAVVGTSLEAINRLRGPRQQAQAAMQPVYESAAPAAAGLYAVTSAGRSRLLLEPGGNCSREAALLRNYCFARPIALLQREPGRKTVTVVTMNNYWQLGTWIPLGNGQGWNVYEVKRQGDGFVAERDRQFNTKVPFPNGCNPAQVQAEGWIVGSGALGKVAIEAKKYLCDQPLPDVLTATAGDDLGVTEGPDSYASQRGPSPRPATSPPASEPYGGQWSAFGLAPVRPGYDPLAGTSVDIVGSPGPSAPAPRKRKTR